MKIYNNYSKHIGPSIDCAVVYQCHRYFAQRWDLLIKNDAVTNKWCENQCKANATSYQYSGTILNTCYCRETKPKYIEYTALDYCTSYMNCIGDTKKICGGLYNSYEQITVSKIANGEWSMWNDWKFCEVNCVQEDTTNGTQRRWRTCNSSTCSGKDMEERQCSKAGICKGMRPRKLLCKCPKRLVNTKWHFLDGKNITDAEVKENVLEDFNKNIKSEISVDKRTVSKEVRRKNSSVNTRKSAQSLGWGCIVFLIRPVVFLIAIDILNCCIHFQTYFCQRKRNRVRAISVIQVQSDSSKPLQENVSITEKYYATTCGNNFHPHEMKRETYQRRREDQHSRMEWMQYI
ncbi:unnamed protein product [Mytilus coruscus]|uniref:WSC domain-containing protein n=1 Tax=Mytilus coruscus TaxID=42192 RepID=A0A6J8A0Y3_MYTCO|nr:unnamed protein product [Mytilus coruscus]